MGNKKSRNIETPVVADNGEAKAAPARAIAKGRVYVLVHYPQEADEAEGTQFNSDQFAQLLAELQQVSCVNQLAARGVGFAATCS